MQQRQGSALAVRQPLAAAVFAVGLLVVPLAAQENAAPRVSLGFASGPPGKQITIPILLDGATGRKIGRVVSQLRFPATSLKFIRLERAALLEPDAFEAVAQLRDLPTAAPPLAGEPKAAQPKEGIDVLEVRISSKKADTVLRDGILGYLVFQIPPETNPEKTPEIVLAHDTRMFAGREDTGVPLAVVSDETKLVVEKPGLPVISCFFYMH